MTILREEDERARLLAHKLVLMVTAAGHPKANPAGYREARERVLATFSDGEYAKEVSRAIDDLAESERELAQALKNRDGDRDSLVRLLTEGCGL